jgi:anti-sigma B factor antagonist
MSMNLKIRHVGGVTVLDLSGRITLGEGSIGLRDAIRDALAAGSKKILLNVADVNYIDSAGGDLKLMNLSKKVKDLLVITKLLTIFDVKENETDAIAAFA